MVQGLRFIFTRVCYFVSNISLDVWQSVSICTLFRPRKSKLASVSSGTLAGIHCLSRVPNHLNMCFLSTFFAENVSATDYSFEYTSFCHVIRRRTVVNLTENIRVLQVNLSSDR